MGRPRQYPDDAARKQAHRARQKEALVDPTLPERDIEQEPDRPVVDETSDAAVAAGSISLEDYVEMIKREAAAYADSIGETDGPYEFTKGIILTDRKKDRIKRAENYARWRYQGVLDGEVETL